jgi:hypothetical protein
VKRTLIFLLLTIGLIFAYDKPDNFKGMKFGTDRRVVIKTLRESNYKVNREIQTQDIMVDIKGKTSIWVDNYRIGNNEYKLECWFYNDTFYSFSFHGSNAKYLKNVFEKKFGPCIDSSFQSYNWRFPPSIWKKIPSYKAYIKIENGYSVHACVYDNILSNKVYKFEEQKRIEEEQKASEEEQKRINNAIDDF